MNASMSTHLELARVLATLMVFFGHAKIFYAPLEQWANGFNPGRDAVIIFFVLSGYVISWCGRERESSALQFAINRAARIYSVALPALTLAFAVALFGSWWKESPVDYAFDKLWIYIPLYLGFAGSFWSLSEVPPSNFPWWSLNYEVWYYVLFGVLMYGRGAWRWAGALMIAILVGPKILLLWPMWLSGSLLYFYGHRVRMSPWFAKALVFLTPITYFFVKFFSVDTLLDDQVRGLFSAFGHAAPVEPLAGDYLVAVLVLLNFAGAQQVDFNWGIRPVRYIAALASCSFSLYLFHMPLFEFVQLFWTSNDSLTAYFLIVLGCAAVIAIMARYTEHRKSLYRTAFKATFAALTPANLRAAASRRRHFP